MIELKLQLNIVGGNKLAYKIETETNIETTEKEKRLAVKIHNAMSRGFDRGPEYQNPLGFDIKEL